MTQPRPVLAGTTTMVSRRVSQRQFLLLPTPAICTIFRYCLALASESTGVIVHVACVLSNHYHLIVTDPHARLPDFVYILNKYVAKCTNAYHGRWENLFAAGTQASYVRLADDAAILEKAVYAITNPVAAYLVSRSSLWPGVCLWQPGSYKVERPSYFFRDDGSMPASLKLEIKPLPLGDLCTREVLELLGKAVKTREAEIRRKARDEGRKFLGVARVLAQRPTDCPQSHEARRGLSPLVATRDKWRRIEVLARLKEFESEHERARCAFVAGDRDVIFPVGTYLMRVQFGARCAET